MYIENCNITNNSAIDYGGGIHLVNFSNPIIEGCDLIYNFADNGGGAISMIHYCEPNFIECSINNNNTTLGGSKGGGIYCDGYCNATFESCSISNNSADQGGGIHCHFYDDPVFSDCIISNNISISAEPINTGGGGISCVEESSPEFYNCIITNNTASRCGGGVFCNHAHPQFEESIIDNNTALYGGAFYSMQSIILISNSDICNNRALEQGGGFYCFLNSAIIFGSAIIWLNQPEQILIYNSMSMFHYSDLQDGPNGIINNGGTINWMEGNIEDQPLFIDGTNGNYTLYQESPCIDTGTILQYDPDGTRTDMGIYTSKADSYCLKKGVNWRSFPNLQPNNTNALDILGPILDDMEICKGQDYDVWWDGLEWQNDIGDFRSIDGYKIEMNQDAELPVPGYLEEPETVIALYANQENWIGYFLPYSQSPEDAFAHVWNFITYIRADGWGMIRDGEGDWKGSRDDLSVDYGKSYIVGVARDAPFFTWNDGGNAREEYTKTETSVFLYEEESDYMMIFVDSTKNIAGVDEIGIYLDDECIGASVVEEFPVFIPAYVNDDSTQTKGNGELTFQTATYGKSIHEQAPFYVYDNLMKDFVEKSVKLNAESHAFVRLGKGTGISCPDKFIVYQNYPNPIRNMTNISFILPQDNSEADIKIYNIKGQLVKELGFRASDIGFKSVWDCTDNHNKQVSNGIYFYKVTSGEYSELKKMLLVR